MAAAPEPYLLQRGACGTDRLYRETVGKDEAMRINHQVVVFDAADLAAESEFWAGMLDGTVDAEDDWHMVMVNGEPRVGVQLAPGHVAPDWPDGTPEQQIHLDLWVEDFPVAHERVTSLGAKVLKLADAGSGDNFQVYADPAGHPFCLCWVEPAGRD
jgi:predicted enzyme related to lactoylglutathione lyase